MENNKLLHWGIKDMRWGIRRWQNKDGSLTPAGRKRYADDAVDSEERKAREELEKQVREEGKKRALKSGDLDQIAKYRGDMTNDELRKALERVDLEKRLSDAYSTGRKSGFDKTMSVVDKIDKARGAADKLVGVYNLAAKINNSFNKKFQMKEIDGKVVSEVDAYKNELLNTGTVQEVIKNIKLFNAQEIQTAKQRFENEEAIRKRAKNAKYQQVDIDDILDK
jgi:hypothetical protein